MQTRLNSHQSLKQAGTPTLLNLKKCRFQSTDQINAFTGIDLRHYESGNFLAKEHITKRGNPYARKILFKCIHNITSASHTNRCHIADFYEKCITSLRITNFTITL